MSELIQARVPHPAPDTRQTAAVARPDDEGHVSFEEFYTSRYLWLCNTLRLMDPTRDTRYVEDAAQDALLVARRDWETISALDKPEQWLLKIALRRLRRAQARDRARDRLLGATQIDPVLVDPGAMYERCEQRHDLVAALRRLPPRQREAIVLNGLRDLPVADVAEIMSVAEGTVKATLHAARRALKQQLELGRTAGVR